MRIFLRTFNNKINSKTGTRLPDGVYRGTPEWITFQNILIDCLKSLDHEILDQVEHPGENDLFFLDDSYKKVYVHQSKREKPHGDLFWMQMHMRELFTIDTNGWGADHSRNDFKPGVLNAEEATVYCEALSSKLHASNTSKIDQPRETSDTPGNFILVPLQVPRDYTIRNHSPITVRYFVDSIMAWAEETGTQVCIKMHPNNRIDADLHQAVDEAALSSSFVHKVEGNIHELIKRSSGVFVINSGTGFESLIHGRPVATFGNCDYNKVTFNADIRRLNEARDFLFGYPDEYRRMGYEFVKWYRTMHAYDVTDHNTPARLTEYLRSNL